MTSFCSQQRQHTSPRESRAKWQFIKWKWGRTRSHSREVGREVGVVSRWRRCDTWIIKLYRKNFLRFNLLLFCVLKTYFCFRLHSSQRCMRNLYSFFEMELAEKIVNSRESRGFSIFACQSLRRVDDAVKSCARESRVFNGAAEKKLSDQSRIAK